MKFLPVTAMIESPTGQPIALIRAKFGRMRQSHLQVEIALGPSFALWIGQYSFEKAIEYARERQHLPARESVTIAYYSPLLHKPEN